MWMPMAAHEAAWGRRTSKKQEEQKRTQSFLSTNGKSDFTVATQNMSQPPMLNHSYRMSRQNASEHVSQSKTHTWETARTHNKYQLGESKCNESFVTKWLQQKQTQTNAWAMSQTSTDCHVSHRLQHTIHSDKELTSRCNFERKVVDRYLPTCCESQVSYCTLQTK